MFTQQPALLFVSESGMNNCKFENMNKRTKNDIIVREINSVAEKWNWNIFDKSIYTDG